MSRTIRRTKESWREYWYVDAWFIEIAYEHRIPTVNTRYDIPYDIRYHKYHSDNHGGRWNPPKDFRKSLNSEYRAKNKAILKNAIQWNNDEPMFIPFIHTAAHLYW